MSFATGWAGAATAILTQTTTIRATGTHTVAQLVAKTLGNSRMNKYRWIGKRIVHAHAPVGSPKAMSYCRPDGPLADQHCHGCGYHMCSCPPKPKKFGLFYPAGCDVSEYRAYL